MIAREDSLVWAVAAFELYRTPSRIGAAAKAATPVATILDGLDPGVAERVTNDAEALDRAGVGALLVTDARYPDRLASVPGAPPVLFYRGNLDLLSNPAVGMCGSRDASEEGLAAASTCGEQVARNGLTVVSGYARGVDMATHVGALTVGGSTIIVLAEGITYFKAKRELQESGADEHNVLVLSQFAPRQTWNAGAAMARNGVIVGLSRALVVIEAKDKGGTLDAGMQALRMRRPLAALDFRAGAPKGNELLFGKGARRIGSRSELMRMLLSIGEPASQASFTW